MFIFCMAVIGAFWSVLLVIVRARKAMSMLRLDSGIKWVALGRMR